MVNNKRLSHVHMGLRMKTEDNVKWGQIVTGIRSFKSLKAKLNMSIFILIATRRSERVLGKRIGFIGKKEEKTKVTLCYEMVLPRGREISSSHISTS